MAKKLVKASEITVAAAVKAEIERLLVPFESWESVSNPESYIEDSLGKYIKGIEMMLSKALDLNDIPLSRALTLHLIKLSKMGRAKADVSIGVSQLRDELNFSGVETEKLKELLGRENG